jgi:hypothetical protein
MLGNFLLRHWNPFEFVVSVASTKHLINPSFLWKEEGISSWNYWEECAGHCVFPACRSSSVPGYTWCNVRL